MAAIQKQNEQIAQFQAEIFARQAQIDTCSASAYWHEGNYNYLALGNSITKHPLCDYWWNEIGMAATTEEKDYFHLVVKYLQNSYGEVQAQAFNVYYWEIISADRAQTLSAWDAYLSEELDLVTIQLSENVLDTATFEKDFREMIVYVTEKCPNAQIIVIDDFWSDEKSEMKKRAIDRLNVAFVDLSEIRGDSTYQAGMGTMVYDAEGNSHKLEHDGVSVHPGDRGMQYYMEKIVSLIEKTD